MLDFTPDAPVVSGQLDISGDFTLALEYEDGGTGTVTGDYRSGDITTDLRNSPKAFHTCSGWSDHGAGEGFALG